MGSSRSSLVRALKGGFGIQYWGETYTASHLAAAPHGLLILEATRVGTHETSAEGEILFDCDEVSEIRQGGKRVLGYLNLTEIEVYRDYWRDHARQTSPEGLFSAAWIGPRTSDDERLARYWTPAWEAMLLGRVDRLMARGFDGVFLDDLLHYFSFVSGEFLDWAGTGPGQRRTTFAAAMMELVLRLTDRVRRHRPDAVVVVNNGVFLPGDAAAEIGAAAEELTERYLDAIDGILVESAFGAGENAVTHRALSDRYASRGICVLTVDFADQVGAVTQTPFREYVRSRAAGLGFAPYAVDDPMFDRLYPPLTS